MKNENNTTSQSTDPESDALPRLMDASMKNLFKNRHMVQALLEQTDILPQNVVASLDFDSLELAESSHIAFNLAQRHNDVIWKIHWQDTTLCYLCLMIELQSKAESFMAARILEYSAQLWQTIIKTDAKVKRLPFILPVVIYNGQSPWSAAVSTSDLMDPIPAGLEQYQPKQDYFLLDLRHIQTQEYTEERNPLGLLTKLSQCTDPDSFISVVKDIKSYMNTHGLNILWELFLLYIVNVMLRGKEKLQKTLDLQSKEKIMTLLQENVYDLYETAIMKGEARGEAQGKAKMAEDMARSLLADGFPMEFVMKHTHLSAEDIEKLTQE